MATLIGTPQDLDNIRNDLSGTYELANDIDMSSWGDFEPLSNLENRFTGSLDGKGYRILNLTINKNVSYVGLFGIDNSSTIQNLGLVNATVSSTGDHVGALVGRLYGTVSNCYATGLVNGADNTGGLIGSAYGGYTNDSYTQVNVNGGTYVGGFIGHSGASYSNAELYRCYSTGIVTGSDRVGGFVGYYDNTVLQNAYWDIETSGVSTSAEGTGKTTSEMQTQSTYTNWDFTSNWGMDEGYPYLQVFGVPTTDTPEPIIGEINVSSHISNIVAYTDALRNVSREVEGYVSSINSNVSKSVRTLKSGNKNVRSFIKQFNSSSDRHVKLLKLLDSHVKQINANTDMFIPLNTNVVNAYLSVLTNVSETSQIHNQSSVYHIENPSTLEVKE